MKELGLSKVEHDAMGRFPVITTDPQSAKRGFVKKAQCEQAIRQLCHKWRNDRGPADTPASDLQFSDFLSLGQAELFELSFLSKRRPRSNTTLRCGSIRDSGKPGDARTLAPVSLAIRRFTGATKLNEI